MWVKPLYVQGWGLSFGLCTDSDELVLRSQLVRVWIGVEEAALYCA